MKSCGLFGSIIGQTCLFSKYILLFFGGRQVIDEFSIVYLTSREKPCGRQKSVCDIPAEVLGQ
jgi:hypothetical protein